MIYRCRETAWEGEDVKRRRAPEEFLPLNPPRYHILVALGHETKHGYALMEELEERTGGRVTLLPGTLYTGMARLLADGLVEEVDGPEYAVRGGKRRFYRATDLGRAVARVESQRLASVLAVAREGGLLDTDAAEEGAS
jgi:DNA-binding PadR family transcriptional regulator